MPSAAILSVAPTTEPVTIAEVEAHLRLDLTSQEPAPSAVTAALISPAAAGNIDAGAHRWLVTFVSTTGETQSGVGSASVTVADNTVNGKAALSNIPLGGSQVTARKLYRTKAGGDVFYLLTTIADNSTTIYTDNVADSSLGIGAPSTNTTGDPLLAMLITTARQAAEMICRRALVTQQWKLVMDEFPRPAMNISSANWYGPQWGTTPGPLSAARPDGRTGSEIFLLNPPLQTVDSIKYYDQDGVFQTLDPAQYIVDPITEPGRVTPAPNVTWPVTQNRINAVEVKFTCGYGAASAVPTGIKQWMLMRIGAMYENREEIVVGTRIIVVDLPFVDRLLDPFRVLTF